MKARSLVLLGTWAVLGVTGFCSGAEKTEKTNWENVKILKVGQKVVVEPQADKRVTGRLARVEDGGLAVRTKRGEQFVLRESVTKVRAVPIGGENYVAAGLAVVAGGTALSLVLGSRAESKRFCGGCGFVYAVPMLAGAGIGLPLGLKGRPRTVYEVRVKK